ncbi:phosphoribosylanthranilate isomerase [Rhodococcus sp. NPDC058521]|uniref:phosphoribosylanthranilate isomerase n=1 Tax=Rhodococcus sp. NPDC058521 TaxID=3346536 RepID=UPI00364E71CF
MTFIKVCGLRDEATVELAVCLRVDAVGFVFAESARKVLPEEAAALVALVPASTLAVGVFKGMDVADVIAAAETAKLGIVQVHDLASAEDVDRLHSAGLDVIRAEVAGNLRDGYELDFGEEHLLLDGATAGAGVTWDWSARTAKPAGPWILAGGLTPDNVTDALKATGATGVDVSSGIESSRGVKDHRLMERFVAAVRAN